MSAEVGGSGIEFVGTSQLVDNSNNGILISSRSSSSSPTIVQSNNNEEMSPLQTILAEESGHEYLIVLPFIVLFGLCGNTISLVAILHSRLRKMPANQYLVVLTIADSVFLFGIILLLFKVDFVGFIPCVLVEYLLMTSSYVSSWSIAALTLERYLAIAHPLRHVQYGHISRWKTMACWLPLPFLLNIVQFYSLTSPLDPGQPMRKCEVKNGELQMIAELSDVLLCYCLPCCIVVVLNLVIASKVRTANQSFMSASPPLSTAAAAANNVHKPLLHTSTSFYSTRANGNTATGAAAVPVATPASGNSIGDVVDRNYSYTSAKCSIESAAPASRKTSSRCILPATARITTGCSRSSAANHASCSASSAAPGTRILLVVPVVYILLNTPFYLFRILDTIALNLFHSEAFQGSGLATNPALAWLYNLAHYLYYVNFACDVLVYAFSSANFRRTVLIAWRRLCCPGWVDTKEAANNTHTNHTRWSNGGGSRKNGRANTAGGTTMLHYQHSTQHLLSSNSLKRRVMEKKLLQQQQQKRAEECEEEQQQQQQEQQQNGYCATPTTVEEDVPDRGSSNNSSRPESHQQQQGMCCLEMEESERLPQQETGRPIGICSSSIA